MKGSVNATQINGNPDKVYNNNLESLNNVLKMWQGQQEVDLYKFVNDMQELVKCQDGEVFRAFTKNNGAAGNSTYYVNPEFERWISIVIMRTARWLKKRKSVQNASI